MTDDELLELDQSGFIPGPGEGEEAFLRRVAEGKERGRKKNEIPPAHWEWVREFLYELFYVKPLYICAFYSDRNLAPWQGAACWVEGRDVAAIQLRTGLQKGSYLRLYRREEILAHEAIHAIRSGFNEDRYEEFFAYMTSEKKWRRVLGPILQRPWEAWPFLACAALGAVWPFCYWGATLWAGMGFLRLIRQHLCLKKAAAQIFNEAKDEQKTRAILFRLTDREIAAFAKGERIAEYAQRQSCLRWRIIKYYLKKTCCFPCSK